MHPIAYARICTQQNRIFVPVGTWILPRYYMASRATMMHQKRSSKGVWRPEITFVCGSKTHTEGHKLRHSVWHHQRRVSTKALRPSFWISGTCKLQQMHKYFALLHKYANRRAYTGSIHLLKSLLLLTKAPVSQLCRV